MVDTKPELRLLCVVENIGFGPASLGLLPSFVCNSQSRAACTFGCNSVANIGVSEISSKILEPGDRSVHADTSSRWHLITLCDFGKSGAEMTDILGPRLDNHVGN